MDARLINTSDDYTPTNGDTDGQLPSPYTAQKDLILDTQFNVDGAVSIAAMRMSPDAQPGEYISKQRAREQSTLTVCGCVPLKPVLLVFICFLTFGSYWVYDLPGALANQLAQWFGPSYTPLMNANLYSVYSYPNVVLPFFSGILVDKVLGVRGGAFTFVSLITLGTVGFCMGVQARLYPLALAGRFVFGLGGESLTVVQNTFVVRWFDGRYLALAFALVLAFARVGTSVNFVVSPKLAADGVPISIWFGALMTVVSFGMCCCAAYTDWWADAAITRQRRRYIRELPALQRAYIRQQDALHEPKSDPVTLRDIRAFGVESWLLFAICVFFYIGVLSFYTVAQDILTNTGNKYNADTADLFIAIPSFVSILASPTFGFSIDRVGRALYWIVVASGMLCVGHIFFLLMALDVPFALAATPVPVMLWIGAAYAMGGAAVWPILSYVLEPRLCGTGYGAMTAIQNAGLALFPQIIAAIRSIHSIHGTPTEYVAAILVFVACAGIAGGLTLLLITVDRRSGRRLNASAAERAQRKAEEDRLSGQGKVADSGVVGGGMVDGGEEVVGMQDVDGDGVDDRDQEDGVNSALDGNGMY